MTRPLAIDFSLQPERSGWRSRIFMLLALGIFAISLAHYSDTAMRLDQARERIETLSTRIDKDRHSEHADQSSLVEKNPRIETLINVRWDDMLAAIEHATTVDVAVISIQADPGKQIVTLTGQARSYTHALEFVKRLPDGKAFESAYLASHLVVEDDPDRPVDFVVEAQWITH